MTDLEITQLCAKAMGYPSDGYANKYGLLVIMEVPFTFNPLTDDIQAMALVKKFGPQIEKNGDEWLVEYEEISVWNVDLNRAICECVAKIQAAK